MIKGLMRCFSGKEVRAHPRRKAYDLVKIHLESDSNSPQLRNIKDLSAGGFQFSINQELKPGQPLKLKLNLADHGRVVEASAKVVWARRRPLRGGYDVGVVFQNLSDPDRSFIDGVVR